MEKAYTCGYNHCLHKGEKVLEQDSVIIGNRRFHKDCAEVRRYIEEIKEVYYDDVDKRVNFAQLSCAINNIVFNKGVDPRYLLFALKYIISIKAKINSPYTLHYLPKNNKILNLWKKEVDIPDNR